MSTKRCSKCGEDKPLEEFYADHSMKDGLWSSCKVCVRLRKRAYRHANPDLVRRQKWEHKLCSTYGLAVEEFAWRLYRQSFHCQICTRRLEANRDTHVDHNHETGEVRGLLCNGCNTALGHLCENEVTMYRMIFYINGELKDVYAA